MLLSAADGMIRGGPRAITVIRAYLHCGKFYYSFVTDDEVMITKKSSTCCFSHQNIILLN